MIGTLGWQELLIILVILALLFGAQRVAGLGGALGRGIRDFRSEATSRSSTDEEEDAPTESTTATTPTASNAPTGSVVSPSPLDERSETDASNRQAGPPDPMESLKALVAMKETGVITEEEFNAKKAELVARL